MANEQYNPIRSVNGMAVKCPTSYVWKLEDVSAPDAGRNEEGVMDKKRMGQLTSLELSWENLTSAEISKILKTFDPEYIMVDYLDPMEGMTVSKEFYVGNRSSPLFNSKIGLWQNVSFNIIKRSVK